MATHVDRVTQLALADGTLVDDSHPLPTGGGGGGGGGVVKGTFTDHSGVITSGGAAQTLMAANSSRNYYLIQNNSTGDLWINFTTAAVVGEPSIKLPAGGGIDSGTFVSTELISIIGATTGQTFSAKEGV